MSKPARAPLPRRELLPADEAILWVARLDGLSPIEHHVLLALVTKFEVKRNAHGSGWVIAASWSQVCEKAGISRGKLSQAMTALKRFVSIDKGNIRGDSNVWVLPGGVPSSKNEPGPPSSGNELVQKMNQFTKRTSSQNEHKSRKQFPSTNTPNLKHGSLLPQEGWSAAAEDPDPDGSRSLVKPGEREKITPELLRKVTASLHSTLRKHVKNEFFRAIWARTRVVGLNFEHFTVECPPELIQEISPETLEVFLAEMAAKSGHLRERQVRLLVGRSRAKTKTPQTDNGRKLWPAEQPPEPAAVELWNRILARLRAKLNPQSYETWFQPTNPIKVDGKSFYVRVPNAFFQDWLNDHVDLVLESARLEGASDLAAVVWMPARASPG